MNLPPIISELRKHKSRVVQVILQIALTFAIVTNLLFIIVRHCENLVQPTGINEKNLFYISERWINQPDLSGKNGVASLDNMIKGDLLTLKGLPGVISVAPINALPSLAVDSRSGSISLKPDRQSGGIATSYYLSDEEMLPCLGLRLVAGRNFRSNEIRHQSIYNARLASEAIVTKAIAEKLFRRGNAVGGTIYLDGGKDQTTIIGVVERLQEPGISGWANRSIWNSVLIPVRQDSDTSRYVVRTENGQLHSVMRSVRNALYVTNPSRIFDSGSIISFEEMRAEARKAKIGISIMMIIICCGLLFVSAVGTSVLSNLWISKRHREIGIRRALGARRRDILCYFLAQNLVLSLFGAFTGTFLAVGFDSLLLRLYEIPRMPAAYLAAGFVLTLALGQLAVYSSARRASCVSPAKAIRML